MRIVMEMCFLPEHQQINLNLLQCWMSDLHAAVLKLIKRLCTRVDHSENVKNIEKMIR